MGGAFSAGFITLAAFMAHQHVDIGATDEGVTREINVFSNVTLCHLEQVYRRFGETYRASGLKDISTK
jgi:hypothetical protein